MEKINNIFDDKFPSSFNDYLKASKLLLTVPANIP